MAYLKVSFSLTSMSTGQFFAPAFCEFRYATFYYKRPSQKTAAYMGVMNYQCDYFKEEFPTIEAIDGYKEGYKVGFLCPKCGKSI